MKINKKHLKGIFSIVLLVTVLVASACHMSVKENHEIEHIAERDVEQTHHNNTSADKDTSQNDEMHHEEINEIENHDVENHKADNHEADIHYKEQQDNHDNAKQDDFKKIDHSKNKENSMKQDDFKNNKYSENIENSMDKDYINNWEAEFYITEISDKIFSRIKGKSYKDNCTLPLEDLRYIHVLHKTVDGEILEGEMICNVYIAEDLLDIFKTLYKENYPIEKIRLVDEYDADDDRSMEDNNSSCFNFRFVPDTTRISKHGLGLAVDINTRYNPYIRKKGSKTVVDPYNATDYVDRSKDFAYKIDEEDLCYKLFTEHGFEWGGNWNSCKDYQHFEIPKSVIAKLYPDN